MLKYQFFYFRAGHYGVAQHINSFLQLRLSMLNFSSFIYGWSGRLTLLGAMLIISCTSHALEPVKIGILAYRPIPETLKEYQPLTLALKLAISDIFLAAFEM